MPSLFDDPHAPTLNPDAQTVLDALCFLQSPINITRLAEFLGDHPTARGTHFHGPELRRLLGELHAASSTASAASAARASLRVGRAAGCVLIGGS